MEFLQLDKKINKIDNTLKTLSLEEYVDYQEMKNNYYLSLEQMFSVLDNIELANESLYRIEMNIAKDIELKKENKLSIETLNISLENFKIEAELLGYEVDTINISSESYTDINIAFEALEGERKNLLQNAYKYIDNLYHKVMDLYQSFKGVYDLLRNYDVNLINKYRMELKDGIRIMSDSYRGDELSLNESLAIFYAMGRKFDYKNIEEHLSIPYNLIVKEKLYDDAFKYAYDTLVQSKSNEEDLPIHQASIKFLEQIDIDKVQDYLNRKTKFGMIDRMLGVRFSIVSVYQDDQGADARHDFFKVPKGYYYNKRIDVWSSKDIDELLEFGLKLSGMGVDIAKHSKSLFKNTFFKDLRSNIFTQIVELLFSVFSIKRVIRQRFIAGRFANGVYKTLLMQNKSHIEAGELIAKIVKNMTRKT